MRVVGIVLAILGAVALGVLSGSSERIAAGIVLVSGLIMLVISGGRQMAR